MKIVLVQNQVGKFNMLGDEESLVFTMRIVDNENRTIKYNEEWCTATLRDHDDAVNRSKELGDLYDRGDFDEILRQCVEGKKDVKNTKAFIETYVRNFEELKSNFENQRRSRLQRQIASLQKELDGVRMPPAYYEIADLIRDMAVGEKTSATSYRKWASDYKETSKQFIDWTEKAATSDKKHTELMAEYEELYKICDAMCESDIR